MGATVAAGYADAVAKGQCPLSAALHAHLTTNIFPPHSPRLVPFAVRAVERVALDDWDAEVPLPDGITLQHRVTGQLRRSLTAGEVVDWLYLHAFVDAAVHAYPEEQISD